MEWHGNGLKDDDFAENNFINKIKGFFFFWLSLCFYNIHWTPCRHQCISPLYIYSYTYSIVSNLSNGRFYMSHKHQVWLIFIASDSIQFVSRIENQIENWAPLHRGLYSYIYIFAYYEYRNPFKKDINSYVKHEKFADETKLASSLIMSL